MQFLNRLGHVVLAAAVLLGAVSALGDEDYKPWSLRDHYSFDGDYSKFKFDVQTAEWMVEVSPLGVLVKDVQCEIEYVNGNVLRLSQLRSIRDEREPFDGLLGEGTRFRSVFEVDNGLEIDYSVARFKTRPFLMIHVNVTNRGTEPVEIREIRPAVFDAGCVAELGDTVVVSQALTRRRGNFSMMSGTGSGLVMFALKEPSMTLGVGVLRSGLIDSYVDLKPSGKSWVGSVRDAYTPKLAIMPGSRVGCDPVWMSLFMQDPKQVSQIHTWSEITGMQSMGPASVPQGWVTVAPDESAQALYDVADAWSEHFIRHVLVPSGWQASPGALNGRTPAYPKDMGKVASEILKRGMRPGITFDPLTMDAGAGDSKLWIESADGTRWLDLSLPGARVLATQRIQKLAEKGFQFFVVEPSRIPDDVLQRFNVTREQADLFALQLLTDAVPGFPVVPSPGLSLGDELAKWQEVARATSDLQAYGVSAGPLRFETNEVKDISGPLAEAIEDYDGPVEITGTPKKNVRAAVGQACCAQEPPARTPTPGGSRD